nr:unnamed protein product [Callosobruchus chinensis]
MSENPGPSKKVRYGDPGFEETLMKWSEEVDSDDSDVEDCGTDEYEESEHDTNSE